GRCQVHRRRRADRRRHAPEPRDDGRRGSVPPGSLLSAPGRDAAPAAAPGAGRRLADPRRVPARAGGAAAVAHGRDGDAGGDAMPLDVPVAGQCPGAAAHTRGGDGALRRRHHARAPAGGRPEQRGAVPSGGGSDHEARGRLARRHARGERAPHDPRRARQGGGRAGAGGQDPRHLGAEPLVPGEEAQDPDAPGGRGVVALSSGAEAVSALLGRVTNLGGPGVALLARALIILGAVLLAVVAYRAALHVVDRLLRPLEGASDYPAKVQRARTLGPLMTNAIRYTLTFVALVVVLREVGVDVQALL